MFNRDGLTAVNSNYHSDAEERARVYGMLELAKVLKYELEIKALLLESFLLCSIG
jgi:hypothetical protein